MGSVSHVHEGGAHRIHAYVCDHNGFRDQQEGYGAYQGVAVSADDPQTNCSFAAESPPTVNLGVLVS